MEADPKGQIGYQGDGEQAEGQTDRERDTSGGKSIEREQRPECSERASDEAGLEEATGATPKLAARRQQTHGDAAKGHGAHDRGQRRLGDAELRQALEEAELGK